MSDNGIEIPIEAIDDFSGVMGKAEDGIDDINAALMRLIQNEKSAASSGDAKTIFEGMTKAEKDAFAAAYNLEKQNDKTAFSFTELKSAISLAREALGYLKQGYDETVGVSIEFASGITKIKEVTGQTAEESSRLFDVLGHYKVGVSAAEMATKRFASEGLQFNIETLQELSEQYNALNSEQEKTQFLYDTFGRSGDEFAKIMRDGADAIQEVVDTVPEHLILTEKQIKAAREYEIRIDELNDSIMSYKVSVGNELIPVLNDMMQVENRVIELIEDGVNPYEARRVATQELTREKELEADAERELAIELRNGMDITEAYTTANQEFALSVEEVSARNQELFGLMGDFQSIADTYNEKVSDLKETEEELLAQKQKLIEQGYHPEGQAIQEVNQKIAENTQAQLEAAEAAEEATKRRIAAMIEQKLSADGTTDEELTAILTLNKEWGLMSESAVTAAQEVNAAVNQYLETGNLADFTGAIDDATNALLNLPEEKTIKLDLELTVNGQPASAADLFGILAVEV